MEIVCLMRRNSLNITTMSVHSAQNQFKIRRNRANTAICHSTSVEIKLLWIACGYVRLVAAVHGHPHHQPKLILGGGSRSLNQVAVGRGGAGGLQLCSVELCGAARAILKPPLTLLTKGLASERSRAQV